MKKYLLCVAMILLAGCSAGPTDSRVINLDPKELLLEQNVLPSGCDYYLQNASDRSEVSNSDILTTWPVGEGQEYIDGTGRIGGWSVLYTCQNITVGSPNEISDSVALFSSIEGARDLMDDFIDYRVDDGYEELMSHPTFGDRTRVWVITSEDGSSIRYIVDFTYRNIHHSLSIGGFTSLVKLETTYPIVRDLLSELELLPLSDAVSFQP